MNSKPFFIAIDGVDGTGKSTQTRILQEKLISANKQVTLTFEPGGTEAGRYIRKILLNKNIHLVNDAELLLFCADRAEHQSKISSLISSGINIITDRFLPSTYAYQIFGRKQNIELLDHIVEKTVSVWPDITVILDMKPEISVKRALERLEKDGKTIEEGRFEAEKLSFFEDVRKGFIWYSEQKRFGKTIILNAECSMMEVADEIEKIVKNYGVY